MADPGRVQSNTSAIGIVKDMSTRSTGREQTKVIRSGVLLETPPKNHEFATDETVLNATIFTLRGRIISNP